MYVGAKLLARGRPERLLSGSPDRAADDRLGRLRPFAELSMNDPVGWFAEGPPRGAGRLDRAHDKAPSRHSNADVRSSVVVAGQMSAEGGFRRFPKHPRLDRRPTGQARARTVATQLDRYPPLPTRS